MNCPDLRRTLQHPSATHLMTVAPECLAPEALALANACKISALMVVDDGNRPVGVLHIHDFLRAGVM